MIDWQPIETAPRDQRVLAYWLGGTLFDSARKVSSFLGVAEWSKPDHWPDEEESYAWRWAGDHLNFGAGSPSHWMPLPEPPDPS